MTFAVSSVGVVSEVLRYFHDTISTNDNAAVTNDSSLNYQRSSLESRHIQ